MSRFKDNTLNNNVPIVLVGMKLVDVVPQCCEAMVAFPDVEHLANYMDMVVYEGKTGLKMVIGNHPNVVLKIKYVI